MVGVDSMRKGGGEIIIWDVVFELSDNKWGLEW